MKIVTASFLGGLLALTTTASAKTAPTPAAPANAKHALVEYTVYVVKIKFTALDPARQGQTVTIQDVFEVPGNMPLTPTQIYAQSQAFIASIWDVCSYGAFDEWEITQQSYTANVYEEDTEYTSLGRTPRDAAGDVTRNKETHVPVRWGAAVPSGGRHPGDVA